MADPVPTTIAKNATADNPILSTAKELGHKGLGGWWEAQGDKWIGKLLVWVSASGGAAMTVLSRVLGCDKYVAALFGVVLLSASIVLSAFVIVLMRAIRLIPEFRALEVSIKQMATSSSSFTKMAGNAFLTEAEFNHFNPDAALANTPINVEIVKYDLTTIEATGGFLIVAEVVLRPVKESHLAWYKVEWTEREDGETNPKYISRFDAHRHPGSRRLSLTETHELQFAFDKKYRSGAFRIVVKAADVEVNSKWAPVVDIIKMLENMK